MNHKLSAIKARYAGNCAGFDINDFNWLVARIETLVAERDAALQNCCVLQDRCAVVVDLVAAQARSEALEEALRDVFEVCEVTPERKTVTVIDVFLSDEEDETDNHGCPIGEYQATGLNRKQRKIAAARSLLATGEGTVFPHQ